MILESLLRRKQGAALRLGEEALAHPELLRAAGAHAAHLQAEGLRPGTRVGVWTQPALPTLAALVGNALAGYVSVPLNPSLGERELAHILRDAAPARIFAAQPDAFLGKCEAAAAASGGEAPARVEAIRTDGPAAARWPELGPDAPLLVLYTSGTTGAPKGAQLSHGNAASNLDALAEAWGWSDADRLVHALPLFHVHGLVLGLFGSLRVGGALHLLPRFSPEALCQAFQGEEAGTLLFAVPTMYHRLAEHLEAAPAAGEGLRRARLLVSGSAALPVREHQRIAALLDQSLVERYGLTETLINCAVRAEGERRAGTVGPALPGIELRLVDEGGGHVEAPDTIGEITIRGPNVFQGYLNRPEATAAVVDAEGFFHTGDLATRDADGYLRIVGRKATDLIKTGGYKVGAGEVEAALLEHPLVREAAVVGRPDPDLGERIAAYVVTAEGDGAPRADALIDHVARLLSPHKRPREVHFLEALPRNAMGKVLKKALGRA